MSTSGTGRPLHLFGPTTLWTEAAAFRDGLQAKVVDNGLQLCRGDIAVDVTCIDDGFDDVEEWTSDAGALAAQRASLLQAIAAAERGAVAALVTAPIRKACLDDVDGQSWPGHTELLGHRLSVDGDEPLMLFAGGPFLLGLATVHIPLANVSSSLTPTRLQKRLLRLLQACRQLSSSTETTRLTVLGLNPHAGEDGLLGSEEQDVIAPTLAAFSADHAGVDVEGPVPADGFFGHLHRRAQPPDGVLAMYHDQGLAPYKLLAQNRGVNITIGLKVPRTSPDHGTAVGMRDGGQADATSMTEALQLALQLVAAKPTD